MDTSWITKTFRCVDRSFLGLGARREAKDWSKIVSEKILQGWGFYAKQKVVLKEIYDITIFIILMLKIPQNFNSWGFLEKTKISDFLFSFFLFFFLFWWYHSRGSLEDTFTTNVSLIPPLWTKIHAHWKKLQLRLQVLLLLLLSLKFRM